MFDNLIGTDITGKKGFGNAKEGIRIDNSSANTIQGNATGSQVISGNQVGVAIVGAFVDAEPRRGKPDRVGQDGPDGPRQQGRGRAHQRGGQ